MDKTAFYKLSYGVFLLTARSGEKDNGCIINTAIQCASEPKQISVCVINRNFTCGMIRETGRFNVSVLPESAPFELFRRFGMQSGRDVDKFEGEPAEARMDCNGIRYDPGSTAAFACRVLSEKDLGSHTLFIAEVEDALVLSGETPMTYAYYQENVKAPAAPKTNENSNNIEGGKTMKKWICSVCGYVYEGENPPDECPVCHVAGSKFNLQEGEMKLAAEHEYGIYAKTVKDNKDISDEDKKYILEQLMANFNGECGEVGMYLCMARIAHREGYPEIGLYWEKAAYEEAEHAAKFAELLGEELEPNMTASTKKNLAWRVDCEFGATQGKVDLAACAKKNGLDAIHDTVHEMARDEARHGKALKGLLERYFK